MYSVDREPGPNPGDLPIITYRSFALCSSRDDPGCTGYRGSAELSFGLKLLF